MSWTPAGLRGPETMSWTPAGLRGPETMSWTPAGLRGPDHVIFRAEFGRVQLQKENERSQK
ncbi:uncharacterized protein V6R79_008061 [Siganus canaliculatus]